MKKGDYAGAESALEKSLTNSRDAAVLKDKQLGMFFYFYFHLFSFIFIYIFSFIYFLFLLSFLVFSNLLSLLYSHQAQEEEGRRGLL